MREVSTNPALRLEPIVVSDESTVVAEFEHGATPRSGYQSEANLEKSFIAQLQDQAYEYLSIKSAADLEVNLRRQLEVLNGIAFSDAEWDRFFGEVIAKKTDGIVQKTAFIQKAEIQLLHRDDGTDKNVRLIDKANIHNNKLQVINQYATEGAHSNRYDVTILVNGLPLVHVELKRRGVDIRQAFNQINRYQRDSFWADAGLFEYVQLFVISNGTLTKYYSNTTRETHIKESAGKSQAKRLTSNSFEFTSWWADAKNRPIQDLVDFTKTFFAKHTLLSVLTRYCVFDVDRKLLAMRPYQIVAAEQILRRIAVSTNHHQIGSDQAGGYVWHTTGSGKTLTSFKAAQLATALPGVAKVLFVVDRKDLDYQTMREYDRFQKGAANSNGSTAVLKSQLEDPQAKIIITTIQKLARFVTQNKSHPVFREHLVIIFDECHRSQFGDMHKSIRRTFKNYHLFGFTGTPIFEDNAYKAKTGDLLTTAQAFGDRLHEYTIVDAISDHNVLPFRVDYLSTMKTAPKILTKQVSAIDTEGALLHQDRLAEIVNYILDHFAQKTKRTSAYRLRGRYVRGFNAIFATASITAAKRYYHLFDNIQRERKVKDPAYQPITVAVIYSYAPNDEEAEGLLAEEGFEAEALAADDRAFLEQAIENYNETFGQSFDASSSGFEGYYKDVSSRLKDREIDLVIVVNMFLTGFDATTLNTLWVDKNVRQHGLLQAFSRTNRILNSVKTYGNIVCFRDLEQATNDALALFGNKDAKEIALLKPLADYYGEYSGRVQELTTRFPLGQQIIGEQAQKQFVALFGAILRLLNILTAFDDFDGKALLTPAQMQDYQSLYLDIYQQFKQAKDADREPIIDDIVFEIELVKQIEVNVDYILMLVQQYLDARKHTDTAAKSDEIRQTISRSIDASPTLRDKKDLIEAFVETVSPSASVENSWQDFIKARRDLELRQIITDEHLRADQTERFIRASFRDGAVPVNGTAVTEILPPQRRFAANAQHAEHKRIVVDKLTAFFNRFSGLTSDASTD